MGASYSQQTAAGKTPQDAYRTAVAEATSEYGHQQGYSGAINSKASGFVYVDLPPRFTFAKFQRLLEDFNDADMVEYRREQVVYAKRDLAQAQGRTAKAQARKRLVAAERDLRSTERLMAEVKAKIPASLSYDDFASYARTYYDKWEVPLCIEIKGAEAKRYSTPKRRGERLYIFFGYAPS